MMALDLKNTSRKSGGSPERRIAPQLPPLAAMFKALHATSNPLRHVEICVRS